ncbi:MAG: nucleotidyltransferase domain-containing protein, partial [Flavobacteriales bacterium]|nr:nucleotidyltransferase domain-containing protein [Flavobacteriales bacterium]
ALTASHLARIQAHLRQFPEVEKALVFGSRARGSNRAGSDLDLAIRGAHIKPMTVARIQAVFDESSLPFRVDIVWYNEKLSPDVAAHIDSVGRVIYEPLQADGVGVSKRS